MAMKFFTQTTEKQLTTSGVLELNADTPLPTEPTMVRISVYDVDIYEDNPRRFHANEKYNELYESILNRGLDTTLQITRRAESTRIILRRGGGTRITIMRECFEKTEDYLLHGSFEAMFYPWTGELDVMLGHMTENALHAPLTLFERAHEELLIRNKIIAGDTSIGTDPDDGFATSTLAERVVRYRALGYPVDKRTLSTFGYVLDRLSPHLDQALIAGIGRPKIEAIKRIEKATEAMISSRDESVLPDYRQLFEQALSENNSANFDIDTFGEMLSRLVSARLGDALDERPPRPSPTEKSPRRAPGTSSGQHVNATEDQVSSDEKQKNDQGIDAPENTPAEGKVDIEIHEIRNRARHVATSLVQEYGLVASSVYCHEDLALGFALEQPDAADLMSKDSFLDAVIVHRELHAIFWALLNFDVQAEQIQHNVLSLYSEQSSPKAVTGSETYHMVNDSEIHWRLANMRIAAFTDKSQDRDSPERRVIESLEQLWDLARIYVIRIRQQ